jgi:hypothetical protein
MTQPTFTFELTAEQAEDLFDCINVASLHYAHKAEDMERTIACSHDWRITSQDRLKAYEDRRDLFSKRWVEFYQLLKPVRQAMKGGAK